MNSPKPSSIRTARDRMAAAEEHDASRQETLERMTQQKAARLAIEAVKTKDRV